MTGPPIGDIGGVRYFSSGNDLCSLASLGTDMEANQSRNPAALRAAFDGTEAPTDTKSPDRLTRFPNPLRPGVVARPFGTSRAIAHAGEEVELPAHRFGAQRIAPVLAWPERGGGRDLTELQLQLVRRAHGKP